MAGVSTEQKNYRFDFTVNQQYQLERVDIITQKREPAPRLWESWEFFDYQDVEDSSGERLAIPHRIDVKYYVGELPSGEPVSNVREEYTISAIELNPDLPDDLFTLTFPEGMPVWDGVNGYGWVEDRDKVSAALDFDPSKRRGWPWGLVVAGTVVLVGATVGGIAWRRRKSTVSRPV